MFICDLDIFTGNETSGLPYSRFLSCKRFTTNSNNHTVLLLNSNCSSFVAVQYCKLLFEEKSLLGDAELGGGVLEDTDAYMMN